VGDLTPTPPGTATASGLSTAQAGIPLTSLPATLQNSIASQLGNGGSVQTISRDDTVNGPVYRVTTLGQNGVPMQMQFAANGNLLSSTPLNGSATSTLNSSGGLVSTFPTTVGTPVGGVVLDTLPAAVQTGIRTGTAGGTVRNITPQQTTNGTAYNVQFLRNGRLESLLIGPDGRVLALNSVVTNNLASTAATTATNRLTLDDLPSEVAATLKKDSPNAQVSFITRETSPTGEVYNINLRDGDRFAIVAISKDGKIIRDSRDVPVIVKSAPSTALDTTSTPPLNYKALPEAVKNAVKAYTSAAEVSTVELTTRAGHPVYEIVYHSNGHRDRLIIAKDGSLVKHELNVSPAVEVAAGAPPALAITDLPPRVQDTIRRQTDGVRVQEIATKELGGNQVYQVKWDTNGTPRELLVANDGAVVYPEGAVVNEPAGAPLPAQTAITEQKEVVKAVDATDKPEDVGRPAVAETGSAEGTMIKIDELPISTQNTIKKLGGSGIIQSIKPRIEDSTVVYEVNFMENGKTRSVLIDKDGKVKSK